MAAPPREALAALLVVAAPMAAGCVTYTPSASDTCGAAPSWSDRLVGEQPELHDALAAAAPPPNGSDDPAGSGWSKAPTAIRLSSADGVLHAGFSVTAPDNATVEADGDRLDGYGPLWLDQIKWFPEGAPSPHVAYEEPDEPGRNRTVMFHLLPEVGDPDVRQQMTEAFLARVLPGADAQVVAGDGPSSEPRPVAARADAEGLLEDLLADANTTVRTASAVPGAAPELGGVLVVEGPGGGNLSGRLEVRLAYELRGVAAADDEPPWAVEAASGGRVSATAYGEAPLGRDAVASLAGAQMQDRVDVELDLDEAKYRPSPGC
jgi:hypothetical protein